MLNSNKTIIGIIAGVVAVCILLVGVIAIVKSDKNEESTTFDNASSVTTTTDANGNTVPSPSSASGSDSSSASATTSAVATTDDLKEKILGKWTDSANMSGYEFFADGTVKVTYVNLDIPVINLPINGTANGVYTLEGDKLTTKFSIYTATIDDTFRVKIENNMLSLYDYDDFETATYTKVASADTTSVQGNTSVVTPTGLEDTWVNSDETLKYTFYPEGTCYVTARNSDGETSTYKGIYLKEDASVIIQYNGDDGYVTENYSYTISGNTLSLTDEDGNTNLFIRKSEDKPVGFLSTGASGLIGTWRDGANLSGYSFKEGGVVDITYVNFTVPVINMPINGTYTGTYSTDGDKLTISYSVYGSSVVESFTYAVSDMALTLTSTSDGTVKSYVRQ